MVLFLYLVPTFWYVKYPTTAGVRNPPTAPAVFSKPMRTAENKKKAKYKHLQKRV